MGTKSEQLFRRASSRIPGGVNSPVRAFQSVGLHPVMIARGDGAKLYDVDGRAYTDYVGSWGPLILGHNHPAVREAVEQAVRDGLSFGAATEREVEMAEQICKMCPHVEMVRMVNSGTEAVMSAIRLARGATGRDKILKFAGCYHGHCDSMLVQAGSGVMTSGVPSSAGITMGTAANTLTACYNDLDSVRELFMHNPSDIAAVIVEPVAANMGVVEPKPGFLEGLRVLCDEYEALLIFDEVITGFRLAPGGAAEYYGIKPDLATYGKIIGGGMPVGAYGGSRFYMSHIAPLGPVYQAGTLSGNPVAMAAGLAQLRWLDTHPQVYDRLAELGNRLRGGLTESLAGCTVTGVGSLSCVFFSRGPVTDYESAKASDTRAFASYFRSLLEQGIYAAPSQFEALFLSDAHTAGDIDALIAAAKAWAGSR